MNFESFAFHPRIQAGIVSAGYSIPTPIQTKAIPPILEGNDILGLAQTGTGKTAAFVLPILQRLSSGPRGKLRALILSPTRELAEQTHVAIRELGKYTGLRSMTIYGGVSQLPQIKGLLAGTEIVVACPGRLLDLIGQRLVNLSNIQVLVLDEADMMFDMGFLPDVRRIISALPAPRQTLLFSATMPSEIRGLANDFLQRPVNVEINAERPLETISHAIYPVDEQQKLGALLALLPQAGKGQVLIFTRTKHRAKKLAEKLATSGFLATSLQGNLSQNRRQEAMDNFRSGRVQVMVATDIAARGIDVTQVTHVINFDLPDTAEAYTHRTGRTGRMERLGTAFSLITRDDTQMVRMIERVLGQPLERRKLDGFAMAAEPATSSAELFQRGPRQPNGRAGGRPNGRPAQTGGPAHRANEPARQQPSAPPAPAVPANRPGEQTQRPGENERPRRPFNPRRQWGRA